MRAATAVASVAHSSSRVSFFELVPDLEFVKRRAATIHLWTFAVDSVCLATEVVVTDIPSLVVSPSGLNHIPT